MKRKKFAEKKASKLNIVVSGKCSFEKLYGGSTIEEKYSSIPKTRCFVNACYVLHSGNLSSKKG